jgi:hypothetical protein
MRCLLRNKIIVGAVPLTRAGFLFPPLVKGNVINLRGKPFFKRVFPLTPRHRGSLFPKTFKNFGKMAWKKLFFKRVSSKISARMLNLKTLLVKGGGGTLKASCGTLSFLNFPPEKPALLRDRPSRACLCPVSGRSLPTAQRTLHCGRGSPLQLVGNLLRPL